jgi:hypothetical protein
MSLLVALLTALTAHETLNKLSLSKLLQFVTSVACLKRDITIVQPSKDLVNDSPPEFLSASIQNFLAESVGILLDDVPAAWDILKDQAWGISPLPDSVKAEAAAFRKYGWDRGLSECDSSLIIYYHSHVQ